MKKITSILILLISFVFLVPMKVFGEIPSTADRAFTVKSSGFYAGDTIPLKYVCTTISGGGNISLPLRWSGAPANTKSYAIFMYDLNPVAKNFVHWAVINIPKTETSIQEGSSGTPNMPKGSIELPNTAGKMEYAGPCPPAGTGKHEYKIIVYALDTEKLNFSGVTTLAQFQAAIDSNVLAQTELSGFFEQK